MITELLERNGEHLLAAHFVLKPWTSDEPCGAYFLALERLFVWLRLLGSGACAPAGPEPLPPTSL